LVFHIISFSNSGLQSWTPIDELYFSLKSKGEGGKKEAQVSGGRRRWWSIRFWFKELSLILVRVNVLCFDFFLLICKLWEWSLKSVLVFTLWTLLFDFISINFLLSYYFLYLFFYSLLCLFHPHKNKYSLLLWGQMHISLFYLWTPRWQENIWILFKVQRRQNSITFIFSSV